MIVGTAGHIDHGKSSLVRALTGTDPDRLKEEKERGITIDLGFAYWRRPDGRVIGFVDVPGHERFVHTMLAGAHGIDLVLLVVAADDGVMPQTREHAAIVRLLGRERAVVALTKTDLVPPERITEVEAEIHALLADTPMADAPIIPVSAITGAGMDALADALDAAAAAARDTSAGFRLAVDRSFSIAGAGTVVTGTVIAGRVAVGDSVILSPQGVEARVRGLHRQNRAANQATAGDRCALNLAGIGKDDAARGSVALAPALHAPTRRLDARVTLLASEKKPMGTWMPIRLHLGSAEVLGRAVPLGDPVAPGGDGLVQLVLDAPVAAIAGDRLVLRDISASRTIGGGVVLDPHGPERRRRTPERLAVLAALDGPPDAAMLARLAALPPWVIDTAAFARDHGLIAPPDAGLVPLTPGLAIGAPAWSRLRASAGAALDAHHAAHPDLQGVATDALRRACDPILPVPAFRAALSALAAAGDLVVQGAWVRRPGHVAQLAPADQALWEDIAPELAGPGRFRPPRVRDFAKARDIDERKVRAVLKSVARRGEIDEVAQDHFFLRATVAEMAGFVVALSEAGEFTAAQFRDMLGDGEHNAGRKVAIQALEFFDRHGVTVRRGDIRRVDRRRASLFAGG